jgi:adenine deaminase
LVLATDGIDPQAFIEEGYLDASLKTGLQLGIPPELAYQMVTINMAEHFHLYHLIGSLSPGKLADIVIIPSPLDFSPQLVMCDGRIIYRDGKSLTEPQKVSFPDTMFHTVEIHAYTPPSLPKSGEVRAMELETRLVTKEKIIELRESEETKDVAMLLALDRIGRRGAFTGLLKGFGLQRGAYGTTMSWDTPDMIVVGCDSCSMETVTRRLREIGGGGVYAIGDEIVAEFPAPLCGFYSLKPMEILSAEVKNVEDCLKRNGVRWEKPILTVDTLGTPAIPFLRITHHGYVNLKDRKILSLQV